MSRAGYYLTGAALGGIPGAIVGAKKSDNKLKGGITGGVVGAGLGVGASHLAGKGIPKYLNKKHGDIIEKAFKADEKAYKAGHKLNVSKLNETFDKYNKDPLLKKPKISEEVYNEGFEYLKNDLSGAKKSWSNLNRDLKDFPSIWSIQSKNESMTYPKKSAKLKKDFVGRLNMEDLQNDYVKNTINQIPKEDTNRRLKVYDLVDKLRATK